MKKKLIALLTAIIAVCALTGVFVGCSKKCEHDWQDANIVKQATCTEVGTRLQTCKSCEETREVEISALGHAYSTDWTCDGGEHYRVCTREGCNAKTDKNAHVDDPANHACDVCGAALGEHKAAEGKHTCDYCSETVTKCEDTDKDHACDTCGNKLSDHTGGTATCQAKAKCTVCGNEYGTLGAHDFDETTWVQGETSHYHVCKTSGCTEVKDAAAHADNDNDHACDTCGKTVSTHEGGTATCTKKATCTVCGNEYGDVLGHNIVLDTSKGNNGYTWATDYSSCVAHGKCTREGCTHTEDATARIETNKTSDATCIYPAHGDVESFFSVSWVHGEKIIGVELAAALGHKGGTATCTQKAVCTVCSNEYGDVLGHNADGVVAHKDATCTEDGVVGGTYCTRCNDGKAAAEAVIPAKSHNFTQEKAEDKYLKSAATCTSSAIYYKSCEVCGKSSQGEVGEATFESGNALGHDYGTIKIAWNADYTAFIATRTCPNCTDGVEGHTQTATSTFVAVYVTHTQPTCTEDGTATFIVDFDKNVDWINGSQTIRDVLKANGHKYTNVNHDDTHHWKECSDCHVIDETTKVEHTYNQTIAIDKYLATPATCQVKATYYKSCECGAYGTETFESGTFATHDFGDLIPVKPATCTSTGTVEHKDCSVCGKHFDKDGVEIAANDYTIAIDATAHNYGAWVSNKDGTHTKTCSYDAEHKVTENCSGGTATCQAKAVCTVCSNEYGDLGSHDFDWVRSKDGHYRKCQTENCTEQETLSAHTFEDGVCTVCDDYDTYGTEDLSFSYNSIGKYYQVSGYTGSATDIVIPYYYDTGANGVQVVQGLGYGAFKGKSIKSVFIPAGVTTASFYVFENCSSLERVTFGENSRLTAISSYMFKSCSKLTSIEIPDSVTTIDEQAFYACWRMTSIEIPDSVTTIGTRAFSSSGATSITFGKNSRLTKIDTYAFSAIDKLPSIVIPDSVTTIGDGAFANNERLWSVTLGAGITESGLGKNIFSESVHEIINKSNLNLTAGSDAHNGIAKYVKLIVTDGVSKIKTDEDGSSYLIAGDVGYLLKYGKLGEEDEIVLPQTIEGKNYSIGAYAFAESVVNNKSVKLPDGLISIGGYAFYMNQMFRDIEIPATVTSIGNHAINSERDFRKTQQKIPNKIENSLQMIA